MMNSSISKSKNTVAKRKNVQVAIRIRPMNEMEKREKSRVTLMANEENRTINVNDKNSSKVFGPFDKVYGYKSSQVEIYSDLVAPLVKDVLSGYNCTIFAYGQTSTGKTYTMEGIHEGQISVDWEEDNSAGIIPRALHHLFAELDKTPEQDYSIRVSYVELYNEELYDLLGRSSVERTRLRIFEDPTHKGSIIITSLEEVAVRGRDEVYELLRKGAEKRKTASTLMNIASSRSHSVFTVTVVIKESANDGEELMKQGKLHLVDLAGSENISRSGAIDKRAREAGNINQSLLTLGRVINALTSGAFHVPYRESKLTRMLQDSLGGRTITTIIATVSPASTSVDETCSTLDYAARAKNIKNHPEINQKLSRRLLLKAYNEEIEKLKKDLQAAREGNGYYIDRENYDEMKNTLDKQAQEIEELSDRLQATCAHVQNLLQDLGFMEDNYSKVYANYVQGRKKLEQRCDEMNTFRLELAQKNGVILTQKRVISVLQEAANKSSNQVQELIRTAMMEAEDLKQVYDLVDYLQKVMESNEGFMYIFEKYALNELISFRNLVQKWKKSADECCSSIELNTRAVLNNMESNLTVFKKDLNDGLKECNELNADLVSNIKSNLVSEQKAKAEYSRNFGVMKDDVIKSNNEFMDSVKVHNSFAEEKFKEIVNCQNDFTVNSKKYLDECMRRNMESSKIRCEKRNELFKTVMEMKEMMMEKLAIIEKITNEEESIQLQEEKSDINSIEHYSSLINNTNTNMKNGSEVFAQETTKIYENLYSKHSQLNNVVEELSEVHSEFDKKIDNINEQIESTSIGSSEISNRLIEYILNKNHECMAKTGMDTKNATESLDAARIELVDSTTMCSDNLLSVTDNLESSLHEFVNEKFTRPATLEEKGPPRKMYDIPREGVAIPDGNALLHSLTNNSTPKRKSMYKVRDSFLDSSFVALSPNSLFKQRENDIEEEDSQFDSTSISGFHEGNVTIRRKRT